MLYIRQATRIWPGGLRWSETGAMDSDGTKTPAAARNTIDDIFSINMVNEYWDSPTRTERGRDSSAQ